MLICGKDVKTDKGFTAKTTNSNQTALKVLTHSTWPAIILVFKQDFNPGFMRNLTFQIPQDKYCTYTICDKVCLFTCNT